MNELETAIEAVLQAGKLIRETWIKPDTAVYLKDSDINPVTEIDRQSECLIKTLLLSSYPEYGFLAEESDEVKSNKYTRWIVDPLDGTTNFIRRYPFVAVSIGLEIENQLVMGVVYNPILEELYTAQLGKGSFLNGKIIHVSDTQEIAPSLLASGFPYDAWENPDNNTLEWAHFIGLTRSLRCNGSAALDLCYVADGRLDGYWEKGIYPWDMAAGIIIALEAGAVVSDFCGTDQYLTKNEVVAANASLHPLMVEVLNQIP